MEYKKRKQKRVKVKRSSDAAETKSKCPRTDTEHIKMKPKTRHRAPENANYEENGERKRFKIIKGGLNKNSKRRTGSIIAAAIAVALAVSIIAINALLPTGLVEWSQNAFSAMGSDGSLPKSLSGDRVDDLRSRGSELFVMSESYMYAYNTGGKCISTIQHGYNSPRLETSFTRTLIYDRGSYGLRVDSLYTNFVNTQLNNKIITADICDKGYVAVATDSTEYSAEVTVYDKSFKSLFKWSAASGQISCLKLSPNGRYLAASVVSGKNGDYSSEVSIFDIKSGVKLFTNVYDGSMFVKSSADDEYVTFIGIDECVTVGWNGAGVRINDFYRLEYFDSYDTENMVAVYHPDGDDRHYTVSIIDCNGTVKSTTQLQGNAEGVCVNEENIFAYSSGIVSRFDFAGKKISDYTIGYEYVYMVAHDDGVGITYDMKLDFVS